MTASILIRPATREDAAAMAAVEVAAAQRFRAIGMTHIAEAEPTDGEVTAEAEAACHGSSLLRPVTGHKRWPLVASPAE